MTLWFKQRFVDDIITGHKTDTIRVGDQSQKFSPGQVLKASVGPRAPFAYLHVEDVKVFDIDEMEDIERAIRVLDLFPDSGNIFTLISFTATPVEYTPTMQ